MADTAARIVPIIAAQERVSLNSPLATTLSSIPSHAAPISAPFSTADNIKTATDSQTHAVTNASSVRMPPPVTDSFRIVFFSANLLLLLAARPCLRILHGSTGAKGI